MVVISFILGTPMLNNIATFTAVLSISTIGECRHNFLLEIITFTDYKIVYSCARVRGNTHMSMASRVRVLYLLTSDAMS